MGDDLVITNNPAACLPFADTIPAIVHRRQPRSGYTVTIPICRVLQKPFRNEELLEP